MATAGALRKNGQQPSCEPCRTSKLRCDHTVPVCQRCVARQRADQCIYHPCPLTKPRENRQRKEQVRAKRKSTPADSDKLYEWASNAPSVPVRLGATQSPNESDEFSSSVILGLASHTSDLFEDLKHFGYQSLVEESAAPVDPKDVEVGAQILALLEHLPFYAEVLDLRFKLFEGTLFGPPLMREIIAQLKVLYHDAIRGCSSAIGRQARLVELSKTIFKTTGTVIETHPDMTLSEYVAVIALRWEIIALLLGMAGRATYQISQNAAVLSREDIPGKDKHGFRKILIAVNDICLQFCQKIGVLGDPLIWATLQHGLFLADMHGVADFRTCRTQGELVSLIFALGLHKGQPDERAPFFLAELRTRTMVAAYADDKELAAFHGRPPVLCRRYCNLQLPVDLLWEEVMADAPARNAALQRLGPDGWDTQEYTGSECSRPRVILLASILREMVIEVSLSYNVADLDATIKKIRHETNELRLGLPSFLQWSPGKKNPHYSAASVHLEFLYQDLLLSQTIAKRTGVTPDSLINTSRQILSMLLDILSRQIRTGQVNWITCCDITYVGLPAAAVLSKELLRQFHNSQPTPSTTFFPRPEIIQHLSIFAAHLETFFTDREGDYETRKRSLHFIRSVLDIVLAPAPPTLPAVAQPEKVHNNDVPIRTPLSGSFDGAAVNGDVPDFVNPAELDFAALWEEIDFDWEGDRRVLFN
ncbi:hypothetical protein BJY04DRAFT_200083 [Aspergillus karnatakaensis]|uniref:uncharacterized protein n=1 Tax=Aspergillus karnatakaensis TaxID=1810916 RepID=UPI003CCE0C9F